jgi:hypothetical protein
MVVGIPAAAGGVLGGILRDKLWEIGEYLDFFSRWPF